MKKENKVEVVTAPAPIEYFRLTKTDRNLFSVETVTIQDGKVLKVESDEPAFMPIAFDKLRRKTAEAFFNAVKENTK